MLKIIKNITFLFIHDKNNFNYINKNKKKRTMK